MGPGRPIPRAIPGGNNRAVLVGHLQLPVRFAHSCGVCDRRVAEQALWRTVIAAARRGWSRIPAPATGQPGQTVPACRPRSPAHRSCPKPPPQPVVAGLAVTAPLAHSRPAGRATPCRHGRSLTASTTPTKSTMSRYRAGGTSDTRLPAALAVEVGWASTGHSGGPACRYQRAVYPCSQHIDSGRLRKTTSTPASLIARRTRPSRPAYSAGSNAGLASANSASRALSSLAKYLCKPTKKPLTTPLSSRSWEDPTIRPLA